ncbi:MAG: HAD family hydrolase [Candidatus Nanohaloarchaea archaeon]
MVELLYSANDLTEFRVATLDLGGTLVNSNALGSTHKVYNTELGMAEEEERRLYEKHRDRTGDLENHMLHAKEQSEILRKTGADIREYADVTRMLHEDRTLLPGAKPFVKELEDLGYSTFLVSSAPKAASLPYAEDLDIDYLYVWKDFRFDDEGDFDSVFVNSEAERGKHQVVENLMKRGSEVTHFGNGNNDKKAGRSADASKIQHWESNPEKAYQKALAEARKL